MEWKEEEINYMIENYHLVGPTKILEDFKVLFNINRSYKSIRSKANRLNLILDKKYIYPNKEMFLNITDIRISYIMGLIWSDGFLVNNQIGIEINKIDMDDIKSMFFELGEWYYTERLRKNRNKITANIQICSKEITDIFKLYNYKNKSIASPDLQKMGIKGDNIRYFIRGIMDGDGCIYTKNRVSQIHIASTYNQDWNYFSKIMEELGIKFKIRRILNKNTSHSIFYMGGIKNNLYFLNWLYKDYDYIGLKRKYNKYLDILNVVL